MKRLLLAVLALFAMPALLGAAPVRRDWTAVVTKSPSGALVIGNPNAKVKLVEYLSYTCPHCAAFSKESSAVLKDQMVRSGSTSIELRHAIRDKIDLIVAVVARCSGRRFSRVNDAIFAAQDDWYARAARFDEINEARLAMYPQDARFKAYADAAGLTDVARGAGVTDVALAACYKDDADMAKLAAMSDAAWKTIKGTPSFEVNGVAVAGSDWSTLEPKLRAAGAK